MRDGVRQPPNRQLELRLVQEELPYGPELLARDLHLTEPPARTPRRPSLLASSALRFVSFIVAA
jgi:hypothetical protein